MSMTRSFSYRVFATERMTGAQIEVFRLAAKSKEEALAKAKNQLSRGMGYLPETAKVERVLLPKLRSHNKP